MYALLHTVYMHSKHGLVFPLMSTLILRPLSIPWRGLVYTLVNAILFLATLILNFYIPRTLMYTLVNTLMLVFFLLTYGLCIHYMLIMNMLLRIH